MKLWQIILIVVASAALTVQTIRLAAAHREVKIADANVLTAIDTTRKHLVGENQGLSRLIQQRDIQVEDIGALLGTSQDSVEALTTALEDRDVDHLAVIGGFQVAFQELMTSNAQLAADINTMTRDSQAVRVVAIDIDTLGIVGDIDLSVPVDSTQPAEIEFVSLQVQPFDLRYAIGCEENNAVVTAQAPAHITLGLVPGRIDPGVCIPPGPKFGGLGDIFSLSPSNVVWGLAGALSVLLLVR